MTVYTASKQRRNHQGGLGKATEPELKKKMELGVVAVLDHEVAEQLSKLETENARLRRRAAQLTLEVHALRR